MSILSISLCILRKDVSVKSLRMGLGVYFGWWGSLFSVFILFFSLEL